MSNTSKSDGARRNNPVAAKLTRNGNGNGSRGGAAGGDQKGSQETERDSRVLNTQPSIAEYLAPGSRIGRGREDRHDRELDKATLLQALVAFRKGDFSVRLP